MKLNTKIICLALFLTSLGSCSSYYLKNNKKRSVASEDGRPFETRVGDYNIRRQSEREDLIKKIISIGPDRMGKTKVQMADGAYEVMNDSVTLPDGTYVPLTFPEAKKIAKEWGYQLPTASQLIALGKLALSKKNQFTAIPRTPNDNERLQLKSMNAMMNDTRMHKRAHIGLKKLIDGHFKWYTNTGKIYGFAKSNGRFWQSKPSGAHVKDPTYYDYSHGVRLIRKI